LTGDTFGSARCDCGPQLQMALERIDRAGQGIVLYMRQEGRGIGLTNKIKAYELQDKGADTVEANIQLGFAADQRDYHISAAMLKELGVRSVSLMTNNPRKIAGLVQSGIAVNDRRSAETTPTDHNKSYLRTKRDKLGHLLHAFDPSTNGNGNGSGNGRSNGKSNRKSPGAERLSGGVTAVILPVIESEKNESR
jgi:3,4-dihydroxy 2-butanone 4-phosphate synthase/GTP cyclohydrolase II